MTTRKKKLHVDNPKQYVVGRKAEEFYSLMSKVEGEQTDDCAVARRFTSLAEAVAYSVEHDGSVFEIILKGGKETLRELLVDLHLVESVPFDGCYRVTDLLFAGPNFVSENERLTKVRIEALTKANVRSIITLATRAELFWTDHLLVHLHFQQLFHHCYFPVRNLAAPSRDQMQVILNAIDQSVGKGSTAFVHCVGGRGRTGVVIACWLVRHGKASASTALDVLSELRYMHALFTLSPESEEQLELVTTWRLGE